jgi:hypothetical protein
LSDDIRDYVRRQQLNNRQKDVNDLSWFFQEWNGTVLRSTFGAMIDMLVTGVVRDRNAGCEDFAPTDQALVAAEDAERIQGILTRAGQLHARILMRVYGTGKWRQLGLVFGRVAGVVPVTPTARKIAKEARAEVADEYIADLVERAARGALEPAEMKAVKRWIAAMRGEADDLFERAHDAFERHRIRYDMDTENANYIRRLTYRAKTG